MTFSSILNAVLNTGYCALGGLLLGLIVSLSLIQLSSIKQGRIFGNMISVGLKSVPAFIFPLALGSIIGPGFLIKMLVSGLICFFPIYISVLESKEKIPMNLYIIADAYGAKSFTRLKYIGFPWLLMGLMEGIKSATPLAVVGAIVAEYVSATNIKYAGLGMLFATNKNSEPHLLLLSFITTLLGSLLFLIIFLIHKIMKRRYRLVE